MPEQQFNAEFLLELTDLTGNGGLRDMKGLSRLGHAPQFYHFQKILQLGQVHGLSNAAREVCHAAVLWIRSTNDISFMGLKPVRSWS